VHSLLPRIEHKLSGQEHKLQSHQKGGSSIKFLRRENKIPWGECKLGFWARKLPRREHWYMQEYWSFGTGNRKVYIVTHCSQTKPIEKIAQ